MRTAIQAYEAAKRNAEQKVESQWTEIEKEIEEAIDDGQFQVGFAFTIYHINKAKLLDAGYKVINDDTVKFDETVVNSWKSKNRT